MKEPTIAQRAGALGVMSKTKPESEFRRYTLRSRVMRKFPGRKIYECVGCGRIEGAEHFDGVCRDCENKMDLCIGW